MIIQIDDYLTLVSSVPQDTSVGGELSRSMLWNITELDPSVEHHLEVVWCASHPQANDTLTIATPIYFDHLAIKDFRDG